MFTKISKVVLWVGIAVGVLYSVVMGMKLESFWIFLGGTVITFVTSSSFGMLIEISEGIADSRDTLRSIEQKFKNQKPDSGIQPPSISNNYLRTADKLTNIANGGSSGAGGLWSCAECGTVNDPLSSYCKGCGKYK